MKPNKGVDFDVVPGFWLLYMAIALVYRGTSAFLSNAMRLSIMQNTQFALAGRRGHVRVSTIEWRSARTCECSVEHYVAFNNEKSMRTTTA
jgi:hypothetical protein|mmetsp:Transcript_2797/g.5259  ORF Transcript_2797/g.5259 Transcript_2797/m.5259 type:complete len:91 (-) Transcript_2797:173-445(-)|eukprot:CAMPEP_0174385174 /NCGR_PEP_ID=MMETSP0811_2-20130205/126416_1 /TAXON_ID=73025 ORGANISM="Eutreptiella gymnastica-like, Strain CCMP1594" /NCGR_SAMPLE_ID=MMETSP0811_2 /ASSEMBLY_ACC=CAM_ASM_000667 /LENGTH=90 /DNA_ID=CAMNT_0015539399 /DNA_START=591 /DNA_END=863 /DNA_ORIENTATION=+